MFQIGDIVYDTQNKIPVRVLEKTSAWGFVTYKVFDVSTGKIYKLASDFVSLVQPLSYANEYYLRYILLLAKIKNEVSSGILTKLASGIIPLPHQIHVLNRAIATNKIRYILADEVGLGKTIEAGLIIKELKARGLIKRILVVCPTGLVTQWKDEMREKFNENFRIILPSEYDTIKQITASDDVYGQFDEVISPMDSIKPLEKRIGWTEEQINKYNEERVYSIINSGWDLIIIDEAHRVAGNSSDVARHKLGGLLAAGSPYLLLLTATPHNGKTEPFLRLIRLVDDKAFPNMKAVVKEQVAPFIIRTEKREAIDNNGNKLFKNRHTHVVSLSWDERHSLQRELYESVTGYVSTTYNKVLRSKGKNMWIVFLLIVMQRLVTSSTRAVRESLARRVEVLKHQEFLLSNTQRTDFIDLDMEEGMEKAIAAASLDIKEEVKALNEIINVARQAEYQYQDVKIEPLLTLIDDLFAKDKQCKVIIFTEFVATQNYLSEILKTRGYTTSLLNGSSGIEERNKIIKEFKENTNILISTDAGGEGINLQFSNCVINYDLPWNPMKIEQRIGRVDRIGQQRDVDVYNFILKDTIESRVKAVLEEKLSVILREVGIDKYADVLDEEAAEVNFTDTYMKSIQNPDSITYFTKPVEDDLRLQVKNSVKVRDLIHEEKNLQTLVGKEPTFDIDKALRLLVGYYENYKGESTLGLENYSISDEKIIRHLRKELIQDQQANILNVEIKEFLHEEGYFMLWYLCVAGDETSARTMPIFINAEGVLRPLAGQRIWDAILDNTKLISVQNGPRLEATKFNELKSACEKYAFDYFLNMKKQYEDRVAADYKKYMYALSLRIDAAQNIGIENIRKHKLANLTQEKQTMLDEYKIKNQICPDFHLELLVHLE